MQTKQGTPDVDELLELAYEIVPVWKPLAKLLGLTDSIIYAIEEDERSPFDRSYSMFRTWKERYGSGATYEMLAQALNHKVVGRKDLAEKICYLKSSEKIAKEKQENLQTLSRSFSDAASLVYFESNFKEPPLHAPEPSSDVKVEELLLKAGDSYRKINAMTVVGLNDGQKNVNVLDLDWNLEIYQERKGRGTVPVDDLFQRFHGVRSIVIGGKRLHGLSTLSKRITLCAGFIKDVRFSFHLFVSELTVSSILDAFRQQFLRTFGCLDLTDDEIYSFICDHQHEIYFILEMAKCGSLDCHALHETFPSGRFVIMCPVISEADLGFVNGDIHFLISKPTCGYLKHLSQKLFGASAEENEAMVKMLDEQDLLYFCLDNPLFTVLVSHIWNTCRSHDDQQPPSATEILYGTLVGCVNNFICKSNVSNVLEFKEDLYRALEEAGKLVLQNPEQHVFSLAVAKQMCPGYVRLCEVGLLVREDSKLQLNLYFIDKSIELIVTALYLSQNVDKVLTNLVWSPSVCKILPFACGIAVLHQEVVKILLWIYQQNVEEDARKSVLQQCGNEWKKSVEFLVKQKESRPNVNPGVFSDLMQLKQRLPEILKKISVIVTGDCEKQALPFKKLGLTELHLDPISLRQELMCYPVINESRSAAQSGQQGQHFQQRGILAEFRSDINRGIDRLESRLGTVSISGDVQPDGGLIGSDGSASVQCSNQISVQDHVVVTGQEASSTPVLPPFSQSKDVLLGLSYDDYCTATNNFDKDHALHEGGQGFVFRGHRQFEGAGGSLSIAVKKIKKERAYKREKKVTALRHPFLLPVWDYCHQQVTDNHTGQLRDEYLIVYPLMEGDLFDAIVLNNRIPDYRKRIQVILNAACGLQYLHSEGFIYRDFKSRNILMDAKNNPSLGDFGLVKVYKGDPSGASGGTTDKTVKTGTDGYICPILAMNPQKISCKADLHGVGIVMFELLTGLAGSEDGVPLYCRLCIDEYLNEPDEAVDIIFSNRELTGKISNAGWPICGMEGSETTRRFAKLAVRCVNYTYKNRISLQELCRELKILAQEVCVSTMEGKVSFYDDVKDSKCVFCKFYKRDHPCRLPCGHALICRKCLLDKRNKAFFCPLCCREQCSLVGNKQSYGICIAGAGRNKRETQVFINDVEGMAEVLVSRVEIPEENVAVFRPDADDPSRKCTWSNINSEIESIKKKIAAKKKDEEKSPENGVFPSTIVFVVSGHAKRGDVKLQIGSTMTGNSIMKKLKEVEADNTIVFVDTCNAESFFYVDPVDDYNDLFDPESLQRAINPEDDSYSSMGGLCHPYHLWQIKPDVSLPKRTFPSTHLFKKNFVGICSSARNAYATISSPEKAKHSDFLRFVLLGLNGADSCFNPETCQYERCCQLCDDFRDRMKFSGFIKMSDLTDYVVKHLKNAGLPNSVVHRKDDGRDLLLARSPEWLVYTQPTEANERIV